MSSSGKRAAMVERRLPSASAAVSSLAAPALTAGGKSSLPSSRSVVSANPSCQYGISGRSVAEKYEQMTPPPHALADAIFRPARAHGVDDPGAVAVRDDPRVRHGRALPPVPLLDVSGAEARHRHGDPDLAWPGLRVRHLTDHQGVPGGTAAFVPGSAHRSPP
jgi:hypothetical protein